VIVYGFYPELCAHPTDAGNDWLANLHAIPDRDDETEQTRQTETCGASVAPVNEMSRFEWVWPLTGRAHGGRCSAIRFVDCAVITVRYRGI